MDAREIRRLAKLMRELDLSVLELTEEGRSLRLERGLTAAAAAVGGAGVAAAAAAAVPAETGYTVTSPMVGVFYAAPAPEAKPFVAVGDKVRQGDVLCIVEAMKLLNEITAEQDGTVREVCAKNGQVVEYGQPLFRLQ